MSADELYQPQLSAPSTRPNSSYTANSLFTDSAISMRSQTPTPLDKTFDHPPSPIEVTISDRLNGLAAAVWASEQDELLSKRKRRKIEVALNDLATALEEEGSSSQDEEESESYGPLDQASAKPSPAQDAVGSRELEQIHCSLAETLSAMRLRQQEQRHLHDLTVEKLEAVAQRCLEQEERARALAEEVTRLRERNQYLGQLNQHLQGDLEREQTEATKKEVAVSAMTSAVAGLEGWINNSPTPDRSSRKYIMRGRGRFRGRYYVDDQDIGQEHRAFEGSPDARALHDGVNAWLRGFRDVEEELRSAHSPTPKRSQSTRIHDATSRPEDDEWGEFESAT